MKGIIINVSKVLTVYPLKYNFSNNQIKQKLCMGMATICVTQMIKLPKQHLLNDSFFSTMHMYEWFQSSKNLIKHVSDLTIRNFRA